MEEALLLRGGRNIFGEPNYRCVWSDTRLDWIGGEWEDWKDDNYRSGILLRRKVEVRQAPKYWAKPHRWVIERWVPPESYGSPALWEMNTIAYIGGQKIPQLGPFPSRGDYESCYTCEDDAGEFIPVTVRLATVVVDLVEASRRLSPQERWIGIEEMVKRIEKRTDQKYDDILSDNEPFDAKPNSLSPIPVLKMKEEHLKERT